MGGAKKREEGKPMEMQLGEKKVRRSGKTKIDCVFKQNNPMSS